MVRMSHLCQSVENYKQIIINQTKAKHEKKNLSNNKHICVVSCLVYSHIYKEVISHFYPEAFVFIWWERWEKESKYPKSEKKKKSSCNEVSHSWSLQHVCCCHHHNSWKLPTCSHKSSGFTGSQTGRWIILCIWVYTVLLLLHATDYPPSTCRLSSTVCLSFLNPRASSYQ